MSKQITNRLEFAVPHAFLNGIVVLLFLFAGTLLPGQSVSQTMRFDPNPKAFYDPNTKIKSFVWQHTARFMSAQLPVVAFNAQARPMELVAPMVSLYFYRMRPSFEHCSDIQWEIDGYEVEPLAWDYKATKPQGTLSTETFRFAFSWEQLEKMALDSRSSVRVCNEQVDIVDREKLALRNMLQILVLHSTDPSPEQTKSAERVLRPR